MTVLVTGGAGYIGSHTVHPLVDAGQSVVVLDNLSTGFAEALPHPLKPTVGDIGDQALVASLIETHRIDAIIHFAGSIVVPDSVRDPLGYYHNNTVNSRALIEAAIRGGVKHMIFSSTAAVYGNPAQVPVAEDAPLAPVSPYGWSKLMTEVMLRDAGAAHSLGHVILRYFNVAGADPKMRTGQSTPDATHLIKVAVHTALGQRERLDVFGSDYPTPDGTWIRDYIHVSDLARACRGAGPLALGWSERDAQLRLWTGLFGARGGRGGQARLRQRPAGAHGASPRRRPDVDRGRGRPHPRAAALDAGAGRIWTPSSATRWPGSAGC